MTEAPRLLITAEEAFPAFEAAVIGARQRVTAGFRIFDPATKLRSDEGKEIGEDWIDLLIHTLRRGVGIDLILSDFDPIVAPDMHLLTWSSVRKLAAVAELASDGAPLRVIPSMHPARIGPVTKLALWPKVRGEIADVCDWLNDMDPGERLATLRDLPGLGDWVEVGADCAVTPGGHGPPDLMPVTHHQKLAVIDGETLYIGGLDLNPRRYDTLAHHRSADETWHDIQVITRGPIAGVAERHLRHLAQVTTSGSDPDPPEEGFVATLSSARQQTVAAIGPEPMQSSIDDANRRGIARASLSIYIETQFLRDVGTAEALAETASRAPELELLLILPAAPEDVAFEGRKKLDVRFGEYLQARCVTILREAFGDRLFVACPAQRRSLPSNDPDRRDRVGGAPLIYVHAKLAVFDRSSVIVSSANMNGRSLKWDTEAGVVIDDADFARHTLERSLAHWLPDCEVDPSRPLVPQVSEIAKTDAVRQPEDRAGFLLPYDEETAASFGIPLPGIPDEMV